MNTKYSTIFEHVITAKDFSTPSDLTISRASESEKLKDFVPYLSKQGHSDLLGLAFDVALINSFNKNGDGMCSKGAVKAYSSLMYKPINIEHDRSSVIGHILEGSFTETSFKKKISPEDVVNSNEPFNITLSGVIYKISAKELVNLLLDIKEGKELENKIYASWEVGFDSYKIAIGGDYMSECQILELDSDIQKYSKYLKSFGGRGMLESGEKVHRYIDPEGEIMFLGAGLTKKPAAKVGAVEVYDPKNEIKNEEESQKAISHFKNNDVIDLKPVNVMEKQEIEKLIQEAVASNGEAEKLSAESIASTTAKIADAIIQSNKVFVEEKEAAEAKAIESEAKMKEQEEKIATLEAKFTEAEAELKKASERIEAFEKDAEEATAKQKFDERMSALDEKFELSESDREILAKKLTSISSDEEFEEFEKGLDVLMSSKLKASLQEAKAAEEKKIQEALAEELKKRGISDPIDTEIKNSDEEIEVPNNSAQASEKEKSISEKFANAFTKETVKVMI